MGRPTRLTAPSQELVLKLLQKQRTPLSAYAILEKLKKNGIKSAPIIYRALETLIKNGKVHKITELNSFVACDCPEDHKHALSVLTLCGGCNDVTELHDHKLIHYFETLSQKGIRLQKNAVIQLPITCEACAG